MQAESINIAFLESSDILYEGITNILMRSRPGISFYRYTDIEDFSFHTGRNSPDVVLIDVALVQNRLKDLRLLKKNMNCIKFIAVVSSLVDTAILSEFDDIIRIDDNSDDLPRKLAPNRDSSTNNYNSALQKNLSERETEVLKCLARGLSNKEMADELNISIHTVISHRKNISQKTGIRSQSGLTIYAISNRIIAIENLT